MLSAGNEIDASIRSEVYDIEVTLETFFATNPFAPEMLNRTVLVADQGSDVTAHAGFLWQPHPRWSVGGVYRMGLEFELRLQEITGPSSSRPVPPGSVVFDENDLVDMPAVWGLGLAFHSRGDAFTASLEWDRVEYSSIVSSLDPEVFDTDGLVLEDADELHAGVEYAFLRAKPLVAVRLGAWLDPDHRIHIAGEERELFDRAVFQPGDDEIHIAAGVGVVFPRFQLDIAVDLSDRVDTASLSAIYHF